VLLKEVTAPISSTCHGNCPLLAVLLSSLGAPCHLLPYLQYLHIQSQGNDALVMCVKEVVSWICLHNSAITQCNFVLCYGLCKSSSFFNLSLHSLQRSSKLQSSFIMGFTIPGRDVPVVICSILSTSIAFIVVICRLYTRVIMLQNAGPDDYIMTAAMVNSFLTPLNISLLKRLGITLGKDRL
jgi:hypothetical protein